MSQTLSERIGSIWRREEETAAKVYARLLKREAIDGKELNAAELAEFAAAVKTAKISLTSIEEHRAWCQKVIDARPVAAGLQAARKDAETTQAGWDKLAAEIGELQRRQHALYLEHDAANLRVRAAESAANTIAGCVEQLGSIGISV